MNKTKKYKKHIKLPLSVVYTTDDFNSNDGMLTSVWGPSAWHFLHTMSFNYPVHPSKHDKNYYRIFVLNLQNVLPCGKCRKNLCKNFNRLPLTMKHMTSRDTFSKYIYDLHELVNAMLNKKSGLSYDDVRERYEHFRARCSKVLKNNNKTKKARPLKPLDNGCTESLYGEKAKCILHIVSQDKKCDTFQIDDNCVKRKLPIT